MSTLCNALRCTQALELTEERKADLELLQMRGVLDPKRFYKRSDKEGLPKYFQVFPRS